MVNYKCPRCGFNNTIKTKYIQHLKRKYICDNSLSDNNLNDEYIKYNIIDKIIVDKSLVSKGSVNKNESTDHINYVSTNCQHMSTNVNNISDNVNKMLTNVNKYPENVSQMSTNINKCNFCEKIFLSRQGKWKHLKICKEKIKDDECRNDMLELINKLNDQLEKKENQLEKKEKQLEKKDKQINELIKKAGITQNIQNNIQNTNTNNIKILAYKNTDISHLTDKDFMYCLNRSNMCVPHLIKKIHFNPKKPENHNVYISNIKNKYAMVYDGNKWNLSNQNETISDLIDTNEVFLEQKLEEWIENGKEYPREDGSPPPPASPLPHLARQ